MSYVPGDKSEDPKIHFEAGIKDFIRLDRVRLINIIGSIQYGILYCLVFFAIGIILHIIFPVLNKSDSLLNIFLWIILQSLVLINLTFYVQKFIESIPGFASFFPKFFDFDTLLAKGFIPYGLSEYKGNMAASIILIGTQINLLNKVEYFTREFARRYLKNIK
jgi:hypothetical protein